ncbi:MAG: hypothetical protein Ct9H300mP3_01620 [Gammaproteobacteria bacterium]|nr:MAG: hypothetical protein Ct9H300mP3_01620 [Gammaproteobacteria bacterium]
MGSKMRNSFSSELRVIWNCTGRLFEDLREESLEKLIDISFEGYAIGGFRLVSPEKKCLRL